MIKTSMLTINLIIIAICAAFAVTLELFEMTAMACMFVVAMCIFIAIIAVPMSFSRINKHNKFSHNMLIVLSTSIGTLLLTFLATTFAYLGLFEPTMFSFFEVVFYPTTLAILLMEYIIAQLKKDQYANSITANIEENDNA